MNALTLLDSTLDQPFVELIKNNMDIFRMAERFADPLFEKVSQLSIQGYCMWHEFFKMESSDEPVHPTEDAVGGIIKDFEAKGVPVY